MKLFFRNYRFEEGDGDEGGTGSPGGNDGGTSGTDPGTGTGGTDPGTGSGANNGNNPPPKP